jgi:hypothetical protein
MTLLQANTKWRPEHPVHVDIGKVGVLAALLVPPGEGAEEGVGEQDRCLLL